MNARFKGTVAALAFFASAAAANTANASVEFSFGPGEASPGTGYTVVNTFDDTTGLSGTLFKIKSGAADSEGAPPASSDPSGTPYLSVLGGGSATYNFANPVSAFQFDWGSIDTYNTLIVTGSAGTTTIVPGSNFNNTANGNQSWDGTNGLFTIYGTDGETFNSVTFASSGNSFEVDNLAVRSAVPEPATWAMMLIGFGGVGFSMRGRKSMRVALA